MDNDSAHLCIWIIASPVWPDACLATQIPDLELDVLVRYSLHVEANGCTTEQHPAIDITSDPHCAALQQLFLTKQCHYSTFMTCKDLPEGLRGYLEL